MDEIERLLRELLEKIDELRDEVKKLREGFERFKSVPSTGIPEKPYTSSVPPRKAKPPRTPLESMGWPRRLASSEITCFWDAFCYRLWELGANPNDYIDHFNAFKDAWHTNWYTVLNNFEMMIEDIKMGRPPARYPPPPMPWRELPRDAIIHLLWTRTYGTIDELIDGLKMHGIFVEPNEIREIVKREWVKKPKDTWLSLTPKEYLMKILELKPQDLPE
ncbi:MAG: hypothetical protein QXO15_05845 [Nitrososphaerota archaeon]